MIFLFSASAAFAQDLPFERYELANGMQVVLHVDHSLPEVVVDVWYKVGSKDEISGRSGFAHLFEHLMFMGTERLPGSGFDQVMEAAGGWNNAWTMEDATNYFDVGPSNLLPTFLWMEADRMDALGRGMTKEKLDLQRDVVRNERRQSNEDQPYGMVEIELVTALYPPGHPYAHSVIGSHADLEAASVTDVQDFFANWYVPNNASLVVAGDFDPAVVKPLIEQRFGWMASRPLPAREAPAPVTAPTKKRVQITDQVQFPQVNIAWPSTQNFAADDAELQLAASLLSEGESSRLYRKLVVTGIAQEIGVTQYPLQYGGVFLIESIPMDGHTVEEIDGIVRAELDALGKTPPTPIEMERLKNGYGYAFYAGLQPLGDRAEQLNRYAAYTGTPDYLAKDLARFREATPEGISRAVATWLTEERATRIIVLPEGETK